MSKIVDVVLTIDGLYLNDDESIGDVIGLIQSNFSTAYDIIYEVTYEDIVDD